MEQQENPAERVGIYNYFQGAHINNIVINGTMNKGGDNIYNHEEKQNSTSYNDEQVAEALSKIVGKGKPIDCKWKWAGAIWLLQWVCLYPKNTKEACERIIMSTQVLGPAVDHYVRPELKRILEIR